MLGMLTPRDMRMIVKGNHLGHGSVSEDVADILRDVWLVSHSYTDNAIVEVRQLLTW